MFDQPAEMASQRQGASWAEMALIYCIQHLSCKQVFLTQNEPLVTMYERDKVAGLCQALQAFA
jgi:hypothetical protein